MPTIPESNDPLSSSLEGNGAAGIKSRVSDAIDGRRDRVADGLDAAAAALRDRADTSPGTGRLAGAANTSADAMASVADYVREQDVGAMLDDFGRLARKHP